MLDYVKGDSTCSTGRLRRTRTVEDSVVDLLIPIH